MDKTTLVLPSARAIRHEQINIESQTLFLPTTITMSEFISKLCIVEGYKSLDEDSRVLLLLEAADFNSFSSLKIERNFFTFTKNSSYIFKFFEELSAEMYDIEQLETSDVYGEYEEHITILSELYKRYEKLCMQKKVLDKIFLPKLYTFNEAYAKEHKNIELRVDGHLTNFEFELLQKCCEFSSVKIIFSTSKFNTKMQKRFLDFGMEIEKGYIYEISLNQKRIINKTPQKRNKNVTCSSFSEDILQIAFVKQKVYEGIKKGYKPKSIAVVLADETMALKLKSFDTSNNFNFAMGVPYSKTKIYQKLNSTCQALDQKSQQNYARVQRVGESAYLLLYQNYHKKGEEFDILEFLNTYAQEFEDKSELKIFKEELYSFTKIMPYMKGMSVKSLLSLFLQRLASRSMDDVRGGQITVMGVLETRSIDFDLVIIVDFSDKNVPKKSDKDMFLNTKIREMANLPTMNERQNLQKHYYDMLISRSKEVAISYIKSNQSNGSLFLKQLGIQEQNPHPQSSYAKILFDIKTQHALNEDEIVLSYSFRDKKLSNTSLKMFLECKRKYYYRYIKSLKGHEIPKDMPKEYEIGSSVHLALSQLYSKKNLYTSVDELKRDLDAELDRACGDSELDRYLIEIQKRRLERFCVDEVMRFNDGWHVEMCEQNLECSFGGIGLKGQIDRIDRRGDELFVLDYKTGLYKLYNKNNFMDATDFQLEFYYLLASKVGDVSRCGFYDLKDIKIVDEPFMQEKLGVLRSNIEDLLNIQEVNFAKCEDIKSCLYCDYATICQRD
jgi:hypothetical protein